MTGGDRALISSLEGLEDLQLIGELQLEDHLGPILQNSISDQKFSDQFSSPNFGQISTQKKQQIKINLSIVDFKVAF
jgi:hypothetical protein